MKRSNLLIAGMAFVFAALPADDAEAQVSFGPQVILWDMDRPGVGARVNVGLARFLGIDEGSIEDLRASINANHVFGESQDSPGGSADWKAFVANINGVVPFEVEAAVTPYVGFGINYTRHSWSASGSESDLGTSDSVSGLNVVGGIDFRLGDLPGFAELRYSTSGGGHLMAGFGVMFGG